jgi:hypothetical protein
MRKYLSRTPADDWSPSGTPSATGLESPVNGDCHVRTCGENGDERSPAAGTGRGLIILHAC